MTTTRAVRPSVSVYVDTCVISGRVKSELSPPEAEAVDRLIRQHEAGEIDLLRSQVVEDEIGRIPDQYRAPHRALLEVFLSVPVATVGGLTRATAMGFPMANPRRRLWNSLVDLLPDEGDRWHVFTACCSRARHMVTLDQRTILSRKAKILAATGLHVETPAEFMASRGNTT